MHASTGRITISVPGKNQRGRGPHVAAAVINHHAETAGEVAVRKETDVDAIVVAEGRKGEVGIVRLLSVLGKVCEAPVEYVGLTSAEVVGLAGAVGGPNHGAYSEEHISGVGRTYVVDTDNQLKLARKLTTRAHEDGAGGSNHDGVGAGRVDPMDLKGREGVIGEVEG